MAQTIKIVGEDVSDAGYCLICGLSTKHVHSYSSAPKHKIPICRDCCMKGCNGVHKDIILKSTDLYCTPCDKTFKRDEAGQVMDNVFVCPDCQEQLKEKQFVEKES